MRTSGSPWGAPLSFQAPITLFNEPCFTRELLRAVDEAGPNLRHVVLDLLPVTNIDATGLLTLTELVRILETHGILECCREGN
jgi:MFS superfamily sulfate permease-like transporter